MYNQTEVILSQYELEIKEITKGRGAFICDTNHGKFLLVPFRGSKEKGMALRLFLQQLQEQDFQVEQIQLNRHLEAVTEDEYSGEKFILKTHFEGSEICTTKVEELKEAVRLLAIYHKVSEQIHLEIEEQNQELVLESCRRHYRELTKVRNYIRNRKKKTEFEQIYMKNYEHHRSLAEQSLALLEAQKMVGCVYCHGDYNQHNILLTNGRYQMIHFENVHYNWAMLDLANFMRKMLEKNDWAPSLGIDLVLEYNKYRTLKKEEYEQLYGLLLFPEKFWKVTNHYMNSRKTWISGRDIDKLKKVIEQEEMRLIFMENLFSFVK